MNYLVNVTNRLANYDLGSWIAALDEMDEWLYENVGQPEINWDWHRAGMAAGYLLVKSEDAVLFRLTFGV